MEDESPHTSISGGVKLDVLRTPPPASSTSFNTSEGIDIHVSLLQTPSPRARDNFVAAWMQQVSDETFPAPLPVRSTAMPGYLDYTKVPFKIGPSSSGSSSSEDGHNERLRVPRSGGGKRQMSAAGAPSLNLSEPPPQNFSTMTTPAPCPNNNSTNFITLVMGNSGSLVRVAQAAINADIATADVVEANNNTDAIDAATANTQPSTTNTVPTVDGPPAAMGQGTSLLSSSLRAATDPTNVEGANNDANTTEHPGPGPSNVPGVATPPASMGPGTSLLSASLRAEARAPEQVVSRIEPPEQAASVIEPPTIRPNLFDTPRQVIVPRAPAPPEPNPFWPFTGPPAPMRDRTGMMFVPTFHDMSVGWPNEYNHISRTIEAASLGHRSDLYHWHAPRNRSLGGQGFGVPSQSSHPQAELTMLNERGGSGIPAHIEDGRAAPVSHDEKGLGSPVQSADFAIFAALEPEPRPSKLGRGENYELAARSAAPTPTTVAGMNVEARSERDLPAVVPTSSTPPNSPQPAADESIRSNTRDDPQQPTDNRINRADGAPQECALRRTSRVLNMASMMQDTINATGVDLPAGEHNLSTSILPAESSADRGIESSMPLELRIHRAVGGPQEDALNENCGLSNMASMIQDIAIAAVESLARPTPAVETVSSPTHGNSSSDVDVPQVETTASSHIITTTTVGNGINENGDLPVVRSTTPSVSLTGGEEETRSGSDVVAASPMFIPAGPPQNVQRSILVSTSLVGPSTLVGVERRRASVHFDPVNHYSAPPAEFPSDNGEAIDDSEYTAEEVMFPGEDNGQGKKPVEDAEAESSDTGEDASQPAQEAVASGSMAIPPPSFRPRSALDGREDAQMLIEGSLPGPSLAQAASVVHSTFRQNSVALGMAQARLTQTVNMTYSSTPRDPNVPRSLRTVQSGGQALHTDSETYWNRPSLTRYRQERLAIANIESTASLDQNKLPTTAAVTGPVEADQSIAGSDSVAAENQLALTVITDESGVEQAERPTADSNSVSVADQAQIASTFTMDESSLEQPGQPIVGSELIVYQHQATLSAIMDDSSLEPVDQPATGWELVVYQHQATPSAIRDDSSLERMEEASRRAPAFIPTTARPFRRAPRAIVRISQRSTAAGSPQGQAEPEGGQSSTAGRSTVAMRFDTMVDERVLRKWPWVNRPNIRHLREYRGDPFAPRRPPWFPIRCANAVALVDATLPSTLTIRSGYVDERLVEVTKVDDDVDDGHEVGNDAEDAMEPVASAPPPETSLILEINAQPPQEAVVPGGDELALVQSVARGEDLTTAVAAPDSPGAPGDHDGDGSKLTGSGPPLEEAPVNDARSPQQQVWRTGVDELALVQSVAGGDASTIVVAAAPGAPGDDDGDDSGDDRNGGGDHDVPIANKEDAEPTPEPKKDQKHRAEEGGAWKNADAFASSSEDSVVIRQNMREQKKRRSTVLAQRPTTDSRLEAELNPLGAARAARYSPFLGMSEQQSVESGVDVVARTLSERHLAGFAAVEDAAGEGQVKPLGERSSNLPTALAVALDSPSKLDGGDDDVTPMPMVNLIGNVAPNLQSDTLALVVLENLPPLPLLGVGDRPEVPDVVPEKHYDDWAEPAEALFDGVQWSVLKAAVQGGEESISDAEQSQQYSQPSDEPTETAHLWGHLLPFIGTDSPVTLHDSSPAFREAFLGIKGSVDFDGIYEVAREALHHFGGNGKGKTPEDPDRITMLACKINDAAKAAYEYQRAIASGGGTRIRWAVIVHVPGLVTSVDESSGLKPRLDSKVGEKTVPEVGTSHQVKSVGSVKPSEGRPTTPVRDGVVGVKAGTEDGRHPRECPCALGLDGNHDDRYLCNARCYESKNIHSSGVKREMKWLDDELKSLDEDSHRQASPQKPAVTTRGGRLATALLTALDAYRAAEDDPFTDVSPRARLRFKGQERFGLKDDEEYALSPRSRQILAQVPARQNASPIAPAKESVANQPAPAPTPVLTPVPIPAQAHVEAPVEAPVKAHRPRETIVQRGFFVSAPAPRLDLIQHKQDARTRSWPPPANADYDAHDSLEVMAGPRNSPSHNNFSANLSRNASRARLNILSRTNSQAPLTSAEQLQPAPEPPVPAAWLSTEGDGQSSLARIRTTKSVASARPRNSEQMFSTDGFDQEGTLTTCPVCKLRHITRSSLYLFKLSDTCFSGLPEWFHKENFPGQEWATWDGTLNNYQEMCRALDGETTLYPWEGSPTFRMASEWRSAGGWPWHPLEYHNPTAEWAEAGYKGGWRLCRFGSQDPLVPAVERDCQLCIRMMEGDSAAKAMGAEVFWSTMDSMARGRNLDRPGLGPSVRRGTAPVVTKEQAEQAKIGFELEVDLWIKQVMERDKLL